MEKRKKTRGFWRKRMGAVELFLFWLAVVNNLDSGELDVSLDLESSDVVWIDTMSV